MDEEDLKQSGSAIQELTNSIRDLITANKAAEDASKERAEADKAAAKAEKEEAKADKDARDALQKVKETGKAVAREFMSIADAGAKLSTTLGVSLTRGTELELKNRTALLGQLFRVQVDQMATMQQIQAAQKSFVDVLGGTRQGMELSSRGVTEFTNRLKKAAGGEFTLTTAAMQAMITAGIGTANGLEQIRRSTGLRNISEQRMTQLVNKNSLSFMLYGPRFAKAAQEAEKLGISLSQVQSAQESMVTNLDGTIDTIAQVNQLGAQIDFGTLTQINEFQGPEATLKYLQSTIPPSLFQSASTRALLKGFGISVEDLMKGQTSAQKSAADKIEEQLTRMEEPISTIAKAMSLLSRVVEVVKNSFGPLLKSIVLFGVALFGLSKIPISTLSASIAKTSPMLGATLSKLTGMFTPLINGLGKLLPIFSKLPVIAGIISSITGYLVARKSGRSVSDSLGGGVVRGGSAAAGAAIGASLGTVVPVIGNVIGGIIGAVLGDIIGKTLNKYFPSIAANIGQVFAGIGEAFSTLWTAMKNLGASFFQLFGALATLFGGEQGLGTYLPYIKEFAYVIGVTLLSPTLLIIGALRTVVGMLTAFAQILSGDFSGAFKTFRNSIADAVAPFVTDSYEKSIRGDDTISRSGYGNRTLVTPDGNVRLNNRDTVVAYADDMISGVRTLSLGALSQNNRSSTNEISTLTNSINELISLVRDSKTIINIDNNIREVPRITLAGVTTRNERR